MQVMQTLDLRGDDAASAYVKVEVVNVTFAKLAGEIHPKSAVHLRRRNPLSRCLGTRPERKYQRKPKDTQHQEN